MMPTTPFGTWLTRTEMSPGSAAGAALGLQLTSQAPGVEARRERDVGDLVERVRPGLAGLQLDEVEQLLAPLEHQVVQAEQRAPAFAQGCLRPGELGRTGGIEGGLDVVDARLRDLGDRLAGER